MCCCAAGLGEQWTPRELRHSFVSILSASDVPLEDISQLVGHVSTSVTETVYRHEIRPALTKGATAMDKILKRAWESGTPSDQQLLVGTAGFEPATP
jgi:integrase